MEAVKGYTKEYYKTECIKEGGEPFLFSTLEEAAGHLANMTRYTMEIAEQGIKNDTNCDWVLFEDGSVIFRYYGRVYNREYIDRLRNEKCL